MRFSQLRAYNDRLRVITGIHEREKIIRELMKECRDTNERIIAAMLIVGRLSGATEGLTTGIKEAFLAKDLGLDGRQSMEAIAEVVMSRAEIGKTIYELEDVWASFRSYLEDSGRKHADKSRIINVVMFEMGEDKRDVPFLLQILCEKVNNGIGEIMIVNALCGAHEDASYRETLARAYSLNPDLAKWVWASDNPDDPDATALLGGQAIPGVPLEPQLCARVDDLATVLIKHRGMTLVQPKLDGLRIHIHCWDVGPGKAPQVRMFSRTLKNFTEDYPELLRAILPIASTNHQVILDGELVALGPDGEIAPFDVLQTRMGRKIDRDTVKVGVVLYDLLLLNNEPVATMPYAQRMARLDRLVRRNDRLRVMSGTHCASVEILRNMLLEAYQDGEEGLVCKDPNSLPEPGARTTAWIKLKPDYMEKGEFGDTFDFVVIGYQKGRGRRHGKIGSLWVAIRDGDRQGLWPVCKVGTGLKDADLDFFQEKLHPIERPHVLVAGLGKPPPVDVWVEPDTVIEVGATGGMTKIDKWAGFSLRFPYFVKVRDDKTPKHATSTSEVEIP